MNVLILSRFGQKRLPKCNVNVKKDGPSQHHVMGSVKVPNGWGWGGGGLKLDQLFPKHKQTDPK